MKPLLLAAVLITSWTASAQPATPLPSPAPAEDEAGPRRLRPAHGVERFDDEGGPVPVGYHRVSQPRKALVIAGASAFGAAYAASVFVGVFGREPWLAVPVVGPVASTVRLWTGPYPKSDQAFAGFFSGVATVLLVVDAVLQTGGVIVGVLGFTLPHRWLERDDPSGPVVSLVPAAAGAQMGLSMVGHF